MITITHQSQSIAVFSANEPRDIIGLQIPIVRVGSSSCFASPLACKRCVFRPKRACVSHIYSYINSNEFINQYPEFFI